ncbi:hypothetical protein AURDEDRAFT_179374 [Auricularia subglabra TFB-10046 SS5]|nr:hypothetical protein AURDEDRAFT_179374 [Auricularia subglabra TFB-10046 SS5]
MSAQPPYYVLAAVASPSTASSALVHPVIHYHYADDPPLSLSPSATRNTLIMDFDPENPSQPVVHSLSPALAVTGVRVSEAPGAVGDRMFIIDAIAAEPRTTNESFGDGQSGAALLARFKQRNTLLRSALDYPTQQQHRPQTSQGLLDGSRISHRSTSLDQS